MLVPHASQFLDSLWDGFAGVYVGSERVFGFHSHSAQANCRDLGDLLNLWPKTRCFQIERDQFRNPHKRVEVIVIGWI